jgi:hypothetical protein
MKLDKGRERGRGDMRPLIALLAPESESDQRPHRRGWYSGLLRHGVRHRGQRKHRGTPKARGCAAATAIIFAGCLKGRASKAEAAQRQVPRIAHSPLRSLGACQGFSLSAMRLPSQARNLGNSSSTRLLCRNGRRRPRAAVPGPQLNLEKIAPVGDQGVVGLLLKEIVRRSRRLAQPASRNGSLLGSKRDRKIAASMGSVKQ